MSIDGRPALESAPAPRRDGRRELAVGDQDLGLAVLEDEGDRGRVEAGVQRR